MKLLGSLRVKAKFGIILGLSAAAVAVTVIVASAVLRERMMSDRTAELVAVLDSAQAYAQSLDQEVKAGHMTRPEAIEKFRQAVRTMRFAGGTGYVLGTGMDGMFFMNPAVPKFEGTMGGRDAAGKPISLSFVDTVRDRDQGTLTYDFPKPGETTPSPKLAISRRFRPWDVVLTTGVWIDDIEHDYRAIQRTLILAGFGILLISGAAAYLVGRDIVRPLGALKGRMAAIAGGDQNQQIVEAQRGDEIGDMARALETFQEKAAALTALQKQQEELKAAAEAEKRRATTELANSFEASVKGITLGLSQAAGRMQTAARSMSATAATSRTRTSAVASAATEVSANVGAVAAAAEELAVSSREIGRQVVQASEVTKQAVEESKRTNAQMAALSETAQQIDEVVNLINSIAGQTNLLALNATIEAARAGESGKGFAVVASEVKSLASQTARATEEIRAKIQAVQTQSNHAVDAIRAIGGTIDGLNAVSAAIAEAVEEQSAATGEITSNIQNAAAGTQGVSDNIDAVGQATDQAGVSADEVLAAADALAKQADTLNSEVNGFLSRVRAA